MAERLVKSSPSPRKELSRNSLFESAAPRLCAVALLVLCALELKAAAPENRYDVFSRVIAPFTKVLSPDSSSAGNSLKLNCIARLAPGAAWLSALGYNGSAPVEITLQSPDKLLVRIHLGETTLTLCRHGHELWIAPSELTQNLAQQLHINLNRPGGDPLPPLQLPFSQTQLMLLPALFKVTDATAEPGQRLLEVEPLPELAKNMPVFNARLHIANSSLSRMELSAGAFSLDCQITQLEFPKTLPASIWQAPEASLSISPAVLKMLLEALISEGHPPH